MTVTELIQYYANLLIIQYNGLPNASATISTSVTPEVMAQNSQQLVSFSPTPTGGTFTLAYNGNNTVPTNWNDTPATVQADLEALPGLSRVQVTVPTGNTTITGGFTVIFDGVVDALLLTVSNNSLVPVVTITVAEQVVNVFDVLPIAIQNAFNILPGLIDSNGNPIPIAVGKQLDVVGKYTGVSRSALTPIGNITLSDSDFLTLIKFAIVQNSAGSSLYDIEYNMNLFFNGQFIITDYKNMQMAYLLSSSLGSANLFYVLIAQNKIPKPMAVGLSITVVPNVYDLFGFFTYFQGYPNPAVKPMNTYASFNKTWFWLSYSNIVLPFS